VPEAGREPARPQDPLPRFGEQRLAGQPVPAQAAIDGRLGGNPPKMGGKPFKTARQMAYEI